MKLRGGLVGYGSVMERGHAAGYRRRAERLKDAEIVAVADISPERREVARVQWPNARVYDDTVFTVEGSEAYRTHLKDVEVHLLDTGHFALEEDHALIAAHIRRFFHQRGIR